ncbi:tyrosine-protein phosphatase [Cognatiyoonia sp. IB215446]|uniref:fused DSP-PTPase phosphatase/NAD kinase-like protein n=1 Tax=Cognatiyoonia sp. IB215446 TaxID=3097355 RepID=UPI002A12875D|nr:tyrosine-protein phosphatase [Cognatiyoonia sp. IB215446]MDX8348017.1 tyrosine-protein phosphatase [Cognatiyoonia sp. IB215446]
MIRKIFDRLERKERKFRQSFGHDITNPRERRRSQLHLNWLDHGILRTFWHNFEEFAPGAYRSNHPNHTRFVKYADMGIKTVLNLRGKARQPHYLFEVESCEKLGLTLINSQMAARRAPTIRELTHLLDVLDRIERPFLMHCKSGADRTGLAAALFLMLKEDVPLEEAQKQLSFRYLHIRRTKTGILDHFLDVYATRNAASPIRVDDWIRTEYAPDELTQSFARKRAALRLWQGWR